MFKSLYYVYWGRREGQVSLMKIGMTSRLEERSLETEIELEVWAGCLSMKDAHRVEDTARDYIRQLGGKIHLSTKDWFLYDEQIYQQVADDLACGKIHKIANAEFIPSGALDESERSGYIQKIRALEEEIIQLRVRLGEVIVVEDDYASILFREAQKKIAIKDASDEQNE